MAAAILIIVVIGVIGFTAIILMFANASDRRKKSGYNNRMGDIMHSMEMRVKELEEKLKKANDRIDKLECDKIE